MRGGVHAERLQASKKELILDLTILCVTVPLEIKAKRWRRLCRKATRNRFDGIIDQLGGIPIHFPLTHVRLDFVFSSILLPDFAAVCCEMRDFISVQVAVFRQLSHGCAPETNLYLDRDCYRGKPVGAVDDVGLAGSREASPGFSDNSSGGASLYSPASLRHAPTVPLRSCPSHHHHHHHPGRINRTTAPCDDGGWAVHVSYLRLPATTQLCAPYRVGYRSMLP
jgi:hypothetical protein